MEADLRLLNDIKGRIESGLINYKKSPKDRITEPYVETRLAILEDQFIDFKKSMKIL